MHIFTSNLDYSLECFHFVISELLFQLHFSLLRGLTKFNKKKKFGHNAQLVDLGLKKIVSSCDIMLFVSFRFTYAALFFQNMIWISLLFKGIHIITVYFLNLSSFIFIFQNFRNLSVNAPDNFCWIACLTLSHLWSFIHDLQKSSNQ